VDDKHFYVQFMNRFLFNINHQYGCYIALKLLNAAIQECFTIIRETLVKKIGLQEATHVGLDDSQGL
jgi:hypothetical protein